MDARGWTSIGPAVRLGCPCCSLTVDDPPVETSVGAGADEVVVLRIRKRSAVPALAAHLVAAHPDSAYAGVVRAAVDEHGSVEQAVAVELARVTQAALGWPG